MTTCKASVGIVSGTGVVVVVVVVLVVVVVVVSVVGGALVVGWCR